MKIVILCTKYSSFKDSPYLTDELADALARHGHQVTVLLADWSDEHRGLDVLPTPGGAPKLVISQPVVIRWLPLQLQRTVKWMFSSMRMAAQAYRVLNDVKPDVVVAFSPLVAMYMPVWLLTSGRVGRRFLVQWDFFPDAQVQIGMLRGRLKIRLLRALESYLMRRFDFIGCMSPKNIEYLRNHCAIGPGTQSVHLPLWTSRPSFKRESRAIVRERYGIPPDVHVFVFGGQFVAGRGIDDMLAAAGRLDAATDPILFLFIGHGPLAEGINALVRAGNRCVKLMPGVSRSEYLSLLSACDVGVVCTLRDVTVPTFPSKTVDYLLAGLPILASVEAATDYGDFIASNGVGVQVRAGDIDGFVTAARKFCHSPNEVKMMASRGKDCLDRHFSVDRAALIVLGREVRFPP